MADFATVIDTYEDGMAAMKEKDYLTAARLFRICNYAYEIAELPVFMKEVQQYGERAEGKYRACLRKLPKVQREMLEREEELHYANWGEGIKYDYEQLFQKS